MKLPSFVTRPVGKAKLSLGNNGPTILTVAGIGGLAASAVMTGIATYKAANEFPKLKAHTEAAKEISELEHEENREAAQRLARAYSENAVELAKIYWKPLTLGATSVVCLLAAHKILLKRNAALVAAYSALDMAYRAYRQRVQEAIGEEKELELYRGVKIIEGGPDSHLPCEVDGDDVHPSPYSRFFDEYNPNWTKTPEYNMIFLRAQQQWANDRLKAYGYLFLNEVYEALGLERSQAGQTVGWRVNGNGDGFVDFGIYDIFDESSRAFVNGFEPSILLDFNVDGPIRI